MLLQHDSLRKYLKQIYCGQAFAPSHHLSEPLQQLRLGLKTVNHITFTSSIRVGDFSLYSCFQSTVCMNCTYIKIGVGVYWEDAIRMVSLLWISYIPNLSVIQNTNTNYIFFKKSRLQSWPLRRLCICHTGRNYRVPMQSLLTTRAAAVEDHFFLKFSLIRKKICTILNIYHPLIFTAEWVKLSYSYFTNICCQVTMMKAIPLGNASHFVCWTQPNKPEPSLTISSLLEVNFTSASVVRCVRNAD